MKNKKMIVGTTLLLFAISGICNVINVSAEEVYLPPHYYIGYEFDVKYNAQLKINIDSSGRIDVYIMNEHQAAELDSSGGLIHLSLSKWRDITSLDTIYTIPEDGIYVVVLYNDYPYSRNVEFNIEVILYPNFIPILIGMLAIGAISVALIIILTVSRKKKKRKVKTQQLQPPPQEVIKSKSFYCSNCGVESTAITGDYCSKCGSKIIK